MYAKHRNSKQTNNLVFVDRTPLAVNTDNSKTKDEPTYDRLLPRADKPYRIASVQQHTLAINEHGVPNTISIDRAESAPSHNRNVHVGDGRDGIRVKRAIIEEECQAPESKAAQRERCDTDNTNTHPARVASKNTDVHEPRKSNNPDINDDEVDIREYAVGRTVEHKQRNGKTHYVIAWY